MEKQSNKEIADLVNTTMADNHAAYQLTDNEFRRLAFTYFLQAKGNGVEPDEDGHEEVAMWAENIVRNYALLKTVLQGKVLVGVVNGNIVLQPLTADETTDIAQMLEELEDDFNKSEEAQLLTDNTASDAV
jgi:hypothetical protein